MAINWVRNGSSTFIVVWIPEAITIDVSVAVYPRVNTICSREPLLIVKKRSLLVITIHADRRHTQYL